MKTKADNLSLYFLVASLVIMIYFFLLATSYVSKFGILSEVLAPESASTLAYFLITTPILLFYIILVVKNLAKIKYLCCLNYPLITFNIYFLSFICLAVVIGAGLLWLVLLIGAGIVAFIVMIIGFTRGLKKDMKYLRDRKKFLADNFF